LFAIVALTAAAGCDRREELREQLGPNEQAAPQAPPSEQPPPAAAEEEPAASAEIEAAEGTQIEGEARFFSAADGVRVVLQVESAPPGHEGRAHPREGRLQRHRG
jgi:hypothetical protein